MHLVDFDTLTLLFEQNPRVLDRLRELPDAEVGTTIFTRAEVLRGRIDFLLKAASSAQLFRAQELLQRTEAFLARMVIVPLDEAAAGHFDRLRNIKGLRSTGHFSFSVA